MVKTRICMISDTHSASPMPEGYTDYAYRAPLPPCDVLLHAGDLTMRGELHEYQPAIDFLRKADAELKIVIAGNHDTSLDRDYAGIWGPGDTTLERHSLYDDAVAMWTDEDAFNDNIRYLGEGTKTFQLKNGAEFTIYCSPYQPEFCNWAFAYPRDVDRFNPSSKNASWKAPNPIPSSGVDIILTHGPPLHVLDRTYANLNVGCEHLFKAVQRAKPRLHCFGHIHEGNGFQIHNWNTGASRGGTVNIDQAAAQRGTFLDVSEKGNASMSYEEETMFVNAAIMNLSYEPRNAPWIVDIDLPEGQPRSVP